MAKKKSEKLTITCPECKELFIQELTIEDMKVLKEGEGLIANCPFCKTELELEKKDLEKIQENTNTLIVNCPYCENKEEISHKKFKSYMYKGEAIFKCSKCKQEIQLINKSNDWNQKIISRKKTKRYKWYQEALVMIAGLLVLFLFVLLDRFVIGLILIALAYSSWQTSIGTMSKKRLLYSGLLHNNPKVNKYKPE